MLYIILVTLLSNVLFYPFTPITQLFGAFTFSSIVTLPTLSAVICPVRGFFMFVMPPMMFASTSESSKARSQAASKVQSSSTKPSA